jgi:hypothetical protein
VLTVERSGFAAEELRSSKFSISISGEAAISIRITVLEENIEVCVEVGFDSPVPERNSSYYRANAHREVTITSVTFDHLPFRLTLEVQTRRIGGGYTRVKTIARNTYGFGAGVRSQLEHSHQVCADVRI